MPFVCWPPIRRLLGHPEAFEARTFSAGTEQSFKCSKNKKREQSFLSSSGGGMPAWRELSEKVLGLSEILKAV